MYVPILGSSTPPRIYIMVFCGICIVIHQYLSNVISDINSMLIYVVSISF